MKKLFYRLFQLVLIVKLLMKTNPWSSDTSSLLTSKKQTPFNRQKCFAIITQNNLTLHQHNSLTWMTHGYNYKSSFALLHHQQNSRLKKDNCVMKVKITVTPPMASVLCFCFWGRGGLYFISHLYLESLWTATADGLWPETDPDRYNPFHWRIFWFSSHAKSTRLHVREDIFHHFSKIRSTQWIVV